MPRFVRDSAVTDVCGATCPSGGLQYGVGCFKLTGEQLLLVKDTVKLQ